LNPRDNRLRRVSTLSVAPSSHRRSRGIEELLRPCRSNDVGFAGLSVVLRQF